MKKISWLFIVFILIVEVGHAQDSTTAITETIIETEVSEDSATGALFWISCFIAGALPWVFIYMMKNRNQAK